MKAIELCSEGRALGGEFANGDELGPVERRVHRAACAGPV
jgi:hypothetical protein